MNAHRIVHLDRRPRACYSGPMHDNATSQGAPVTEKPTLTLDMECMVVTTKHVRHRYNDNATEHIAELVPLEYPGNNAPWFYAKIEQQYGEPFIQPNKHYRVTIEEIDG